MNRALLDVRKDVTGEDVNSPISITSDNGKDVDSKSVDSKYKKGTSVKSKVLSWADVVKKD